MIRVECIGFTCLHLFMAINWKNWDILIQWNVAQNVGFNDKMFRFFPVLFVGIFFVFRGGPQRFFFFLNFWFSTLWQKSLTEKSLLFLRPLSDICFKRERKKEKERDRERKRETERDWERKKNWKAGQAFSNAYQFDCKACSKLRGWLSR